MIIRIVKCATRLVAPRWCGVVLASALVSMPAIAQDYGDTPYVPTPQNVVDKMLQIAKVGPRDYVIDLGSGDGRMIITAAKKYGARGFGVDLDGQLVARANKLAAKAGVADRAVFYRRDLYKTDIRRATVITMYLLPEVNLMVRPKLIQTLRPGTRIVSHDYDMGDWTPDLSLTMDAPEKPVGRDRTSKIFYWVVPATVSGKWHWQVAAGGTKRDFELTLHQRFQKLDGSLAVDGHAVTLENAKLTGTHISFSADEERDGAHTRFEFSGIASGDKVKGRVKIGDAGKGVAWRAVRTEFIKPAHAGLKPPPPPETPY